MLLNFYYLIIAIKLILITKIALITTEETKSSLNLITHRNNNTEDIDMFEEIHKMLVHYTKNKANKELYESIIESIKLENYSAADNQIKILGTNSMRINMIVHEIYSNDKENFIILNNYAGNSSYPDISFHILYELWIQLNDNDHLHFKELCEIYKTFYQKVIKPHKVDDDRIDYVEMILDMEIRPKIVPFAVNKLKKSLIEKKYYKYETADKDNDNVEEIVDEIFLINVTIFDEIICKVINQTYNQMNFSYLIKIMWTTHKFIEQKISTICCIFWNLKRNMINNSDATLIIAYYFYQIKQFKNYEKLNNNLKQQIEKCIENFPKSIRVLYFEENVCIRNVVSENFIAPDFQYDKWKYGVFSQLDGFIQTNDNNNITAASWIIKPIKEYHLKFKNKKYDEEYLYVGEVTRSFGRMRLVFTWVSHDGFIGEENDNLIWKIQLYGNEVTLTNLKYNEILCLSFGKNLLYANAVTTKWWSGDKRCRWTIENCLIDYY